MMRRETFQSFVVTPNHPFFVENVGWTRADELDPGTKVELRDGTLAYVNHVAPIYRAGSADIGWAPYSDIDSSTGHRIDLRHGSVSIEYGLKESAPGFDCTVEYHELRHRVFNIEVEDFHTYYVGTTGLWVHNTDCRLTEAAQEIPGVADDMLPSGTTRIYFTNGEAIARPANSALILVGESPGVPPTRRSTRIKDLALCSTKTPTWRWSDCPPERQSATARTAPESRTATRC